MRRSDNATTNANNPTQPKKLTHTQTEKERERDGKRQRDTERERGKGREGKGGERFVKPRKSGEMCVCIGCMLTQGEVSMWNAPSQTRM